MQQNEKHFRFRNLIFYTERWSTFKKKNHAQIQTLIFEMTSYFDYIIGFGKGLSSWFRYFEADKLHPMCVFFKWWSKAGFPLGGIFRAQRKAYFFHRIPPKAYAEKSDQVQLFSRGKFRKTNHIAHFAYHVIKTIAALYGIFRLVENRL